MQPAITINQRQKTPFLFQQVDLVQNQNRGSIRFFDQVDRAAVCFSEIQRRIHEKQQQVAIIQRSPNCFHHAFIDQRVGFVDAGCVDEYDLRLVRGEDALNGGAGGLRLVGDDRDFFPDERIEQRGFPGVRPP